MMMAWQSGSAAARQRGRTVQRCRTAVWVGVRAVGLPVVEMRVVGLPLVAVWKGGRAAAGEGS